MSSGFTANYDKSISGVYWNDIFLDEAGNIQTSTGDSYTIENCYHALWFLLGEYDFNINLGIDYDTYLSSTSPVIGSLRLSINNNLLTIDGVKSINNIFTSLDRFTRILTITINITLDSNISTDLMFTREI